MRKISQLLHIRLPQHIYSQLKNLSDSTGETVSSHVLRAIKDYLGSSRAVSSDKPQQSNSFY